MNAQTATTSSEQIIAECFLAPRPCQKLHVHYLLTQPETYLAALETLSKKNLLSRVSQASKSRILVALELTEYHVTFNNFFPKCNVVEITKACEALDRPRLIRQIKAKIDRIESSHPHVVIKSDGGSNDDDEHKPKWSKRKEKSDEKPRRKRRKRTYDVLHRQLKELLAQDEDSHDSQTCHVAHVNTAVKELLDSASLSGALARKIRKWIQSFTPDLLEFIVMSGSMGIWRKLADLVHPAPTDFTLPYFLSVVHGGAIPEGTFVHGMRGLIEAPDAKLAETFQALAEQHPQVYKSYTFLRTHPRIFKDRTIAALLTQHIPLDTAIWYLEELCDTTGPSFDADIPIPGDFLDEEEQLRRALAASMGEIINNVEPDLAVAKILTDRLTTESSWMEDGETSKVGSSFAKLVERILQAQRISADLAAALMPAAVRRLSALKETVTKCVGKTAVFGDTSESMQVAMEAATIFAAMVSVCLRGELCFFADQYIPSPHPCPDTLAQVLEITETIQAKNCTNLAAALWHYFDKKIVLERIVLVTDEWENDSCHGYFFADLLRLYKDTISPGVELLLVGVGGGSVNFQESLRRHGIAFQRVEIDERRPDLTKFDALLRQISVLSNRAVGEANPRAVEGGVEGVGNDGVDDFIHVG